MRTLVIFASEEGQTAKIAECIASRFAFHQIPCDCVSVTQHGIDAVAVDAYDAVVIGSPIHYSHYDPRLAEMIKNFREDLNEIPSAFFSVSLGILSDEETEKDEVHRITDAYLANTQWNPSMKVHFAGTLAYSKYGWVKRRLMRFVVRKAGGPTDVRYDYEFTDWQQVQIFVDRFVEFVRACKRTDERSGPSVSYSKPVRKYSIKNLERA